MRDASIATVTSAPDPSAHRVLGYGKRGWNELTRAITQPISEKAARARHAKGGRAGAYGVALTAAPGPDPGPPVVGITINEHGTTVAFYDHDLATANLAHFWHPTPEGRLRIVQVDRRAGNPDEVRRDELVYEYLRLTDDPAVWVRWTDAGATPLERRSVDVAAFDLDPPAFGEYGPLLDRTLAERLWPGLPELAWVGPERERS